MCIISFMYPFSVKLHSMSYECDDQCGTQLREAVSIVM